jgi:pimeloyl-ACP methyl ester carboxylesterase
MPQTADAQFYMLYFQQPGLAEAEFERDPRATVTNMLYGASGGGGMLRGPGAPATLPAWLSEADLDFYAGEFKRSGFRGGLNYYRNLDRNWELMAPFADVRVTVPAIYIAGDRDLVVSSPGMDQFLSKLKTLRPRAT